jgi:hypothetical protein
VEVVEWARCQQVEFDDQPRRSGGTVLARQPLQVDSKEIYRSGPAGRPFHCAIWKLHDLHARRRDTWIRRPMRTDRRNPAVSWW